MSRELGWKYCRETIDCVSINQVIIDRVLDHPFFLEEGFIPEVFLFDMCH